MPQNQSAVRYVRITDRDEGQRIDNYLLRTLKGVPRSHIYRLLRSGQVRLNKGRVKPDRKLTAGDELRIPPVVTAEPNRPHRAPDELLERVQSAVCYEDGDFLVINKPADLPVHGGSGVAYGLIEVLRQARPEDEFLELAHRLDRETSGCLVVARRRPALLAMHTALREGTSEKIYSALLVGAWQGGPREVSVALQKIHDSDGDHMVEINEDEGREARSLFTPEQVFKGGSDSLSLMRVRIFTGRTHQIRVHASHLKQPVLGDAKYGNFEVNRRMRDRGLKRMFLHARSIAVELPSLKRRLEANVPLAPELKAFLGKLGS